MKERKDWREISFYPPYPPYPPENLSFRRMQADGLGGCFPCNVLMQNEKGGSGDLGGCFSLGLTHARNMRTTSRVSTPNNILTCVSTHIHPPNPPYLPKYIRNGNSRNTLRLFEFSNHPPKHPPTSA